MIFNDNSTLNSPDFQSASSFFDLEEIQATLSLSNAFRSSAGQVLDSDEYDYLDLNPLIDEVESENIILVDQSKVGIGGIDSDLIYGGIDRDRIKGKGGNDLLFGGDERDTIDGGNGNDLLVGGDDKDRINGGQGNDVIDGAQGNDLLRGGPGADIFVVNSDSGRDLIIDFEPGIDFIGITDDSMLKLQSSSTHLERTLIKDEAGKTLAILRGVDSSEIDDDIFISVASASDTESPISADDSTEVVDAFLPLNSESMKVESFVPTGNGETYYVSPDGNDNNPGTQEQPWKTISYATSEASVVSAGDTILVQSGTYAEIVDLQKSGNAEEGHIVLKADREVTLVDPDPNTFFGEFWNEGVIEAEGQGFWVVDGFRIENSSFAGISLRDANDMVIQNNHTFETGSSGIIAMPGSFFQGGEQEVTGSNLQILNNTVERANWVWAGQGDTRGRQEAISIWGVDGFEVAGNLVNQGNREGIDAKTGSRNGSIHNNIVTDVARISGTPGGYQGGPAIYLDGNRAQMSNIDVYNNVVYGNTATGIAVSDEEPLAGDVRDIRIFNNIIYDNGIQGINGGEGIFIASNVYDYEIFNNTVVGNVQSLVIDGSAGILGNEGTDNGTVANNIFANEGINLRRKRLTV
ncbi:MAG: right-handed parallel beta-helix repeat-containing protein [Microcoleaceae cyanobacterium]